MNALVLPSLPKRCQKGGTLRGIIDPFWALFSENINRWMSLGLDGIEGAISSSEDKVAE